MDYSIQVGNTAIDATSSTNGVAVYNITVDVIRQTKVTTARGQTETPVTIVNDMPCYIKWLRGREKIQFNKETHYLDATLHCRIPTGVSIVVTDKIVYNSKYYEIVDLYDLNNLGKLLVIALKRIK